MKKVTIKDDTGKLIEVPVSDQLYIALEQARREDETRKRIDRKRLAKEALSDYHSNILMTPAQSMSETIEEKLLIEQMLRCLGSLSDYEQLLIHKYYFEGQSYESIADEIGVPLSSVYRRITRIIKALSGMMGLDRKNNFRRK